MNPFSFKKNDNEVYMESQNSIPTIILFAFVLINFDFF